MAVNQNIYPPSAQVKNLPVYLVGIGGSEYQGHIVRPEGYCWHQILFSAKGKGELKIDGKIYSLSENCYFFLPADIPHEYYPVDGSWDVRWVTFDGFACKDILSELGLTDSVIFKTENSEPLQKIYNKMFVTQKSDKIYGNYTCSGLIYQYILEFHNQSEAFFGGKDRSGLLMPVINFIDDNFAEDFPMTRLAEIAGITPQHLCRVFKETMNMKPVEYLMLKRINEAKSLLKHSDLSVAEICRRSGFSDSGYFSTVFRRYEGMPPNMYRKKNKIVVPKAVSL